MNLFCTLLLFLGLNTPSSDNFIGIEEDIQTINEYIEFVNESIHGLLIVHRLLENNNQEINKYVDLSGYQLNFYTNADLPKDIFEDPELWFFEISPKTRFNKLESFSSPVKAEYKNELSSSVKAMMKLCTQINSIRFESEDYIKSHDLNDKNNLAEVYKILEKAVDYYDEFYDEQLKFIKIVENYLGPEQNNPDPNFSKVYSAFNEVHKHTFNILHSLRIKDDGGIAGQLRDLKRAFAEFSELQKQADHKIYITATTIGKIKEVIDATEEFITDSKVPVEYKLYGDYYYYHNSNIINKINRYGNGFVNEMNKIIKLHGNDYPLFLEVPHYFQVIYPIKLIEAEYISSKETVINDVPAELDSRNITSNEILVDDKNLIVYVKLYDHSKKDGDVVSINFNGDWIYKNLSLELEPKEFILKLNESGKNYIVIHTENEGIIPPNTTAFSYRIGSKYEELILETNMSTSSMVEFKLQ